MSSVKKSVRTFKLFYVLVHAAPYTLKKLTGLIINDFRNIGRESVLLFFYILPFLLGLLMRFAVPFAASYVLKLTGVDISEHYIFVALMMFLVAQLLYGMVVGFMLLDERDEAISTYFYVTPLSRGGYIVYRVIPPVIISCVNSVLVVFLTGLVEVKLSVLIPLGLISSMQVPILVLFLGAFAANKVEGLALAKVYGITNIAPFIAYFVPSGWGYIAGILPPFWITKAFVAGYRSGPGEFAVFAIAAGVVHLVYLAVLYRFFARRI